MMRLAPGLVAALALAACAPQQANEAAATSASTASQQADIEAVMAGSAAGWNEGDMQRFLAIYSAAPETSFVSADGLLRGVGQMEARYRKAYDWSQADPAERGVLSFETQDFRPLGDRHALYIGRYILTYPDGREPANGLTSLVFAREGDSWRIIADHSS